MAPPVALLVGSNMIGMLLAGALALLVLRTSRERMNRLLVAMLAVQTLGLAVLALAAWRPDWATRVPMVLAMETSLVAMGVTFLVFAGQLDTPLARPLRSPLGRAVLFASAAGALVPTYALIARGGEVSLGESDALAWIFLGITSLFAFVISVHAWRRTPRQSPLRRRAAAFALAFGTRDGILGVIIGAWGLAEAGVLPEGTKAWLELSNGLNAILFVTLLTYGILSTQLFDVDLRIKLGISRSTVASLALAVVFAVSKVVEAYASRNLGFVAGAVAAGLLLFAAPRLNKLGDRVANTAMPNVQPTSEYLAYKKLEVYRAAVESAVEGDRKIDSAERAMLDRLRSKLGLKESDAAALEAELAAPTS